jgi:hypothetical protein
MMGEPEDLPYVEIHNANPERAKQRAINDGMDPKLLEHIK